MRSRLSAPNTGAFVALAAILAIHGAAAPSSAEAAPRVDDLQVPPGFVVELLTDELPNARQLALADDGTLYAGTREDGRVWALRDGRRYTIARGLTMPSGVALRGGDLYVAAVDRVLRLPAVGADLAQPPEPVVITDALPEDGHHGWKHIEFGPDGDLWVPVGAPCNICAPDDPYAALLRMDPDSGDYVVAARGIRNTVGFDFHPRSGALWFTDNGRDWLGDDTPPCELNRLDVQAASPVHYGYPYVHGATIRDPELGAGGEETARYEAPAWEFGAHTAPLGVAFYDHDAFGPDWKGTLFVAQHGSWNRSQKVGYQVLAVRIEDGRVVSSTPFLTGFLDGERAWGRPVDVLVDHDGALLVSDDAQGAVYRIRRTRGAVARR